MSTTGTLQSDLHPDDFLLGLQEFLRSRREGVLQQQLAEIALVEFREEREFLENKARAQLAREDAADRKALARWTHWFEFWSAHPFPRWLWPVSCVMGASLGGAWALVARHLGVGLFAWVWSALVLMALPPLATQIWRRFSALAQTRPLNENVWRFNRCTALLRNCLAAVIFSVPLSLIGVGFTTLSVPGHQFFPAPTAVLSGFYDVFAVKGSVQLADLLEGHAVPANTLWLFASDPVQSQLLAQRRLNPDQAAWSVDGPQALEDAMSGLSWSAPGSAHPRTTATLPHPDPTVASVLPESPPDSASPALAPTPPLLCEQAQVCFPIHSLSELHARAEALSLPPSQRTLLEHRLEPLLWLHTSLVARVLFNLLVYLLVVETVFVTMTLYSLDPLAQIPRLARPRPTPGTFVEILSACNWPQRHHARIERESLREALGLTPQPRTTRAHASSGSAEPAPLAASELAPIGIMDSGPTPGAGTLSPATGVSPGGDESTLPTPLTPGSPPRRARRL